MVFFCIFVEDCEIQIDDIIMVKKVLCASGEMCAYVSPSVEVYDIVCEGVLCASPDKADDEYDPFYGMGDI